MSRRIDIELTSAQPDGTWTWRAAGALKPRGVLDGALLSGQPKPGDVLRAEADFEIDGITIVRVVAPQTKKRAEPERIEVIGPPRSAGPAVTTQLVGKGPGKARRGLEDPRPSDRRRERGDDGPGDRQPTGPRRERPSTDGARRGDTRADDQSAGAAGPKSTDPARGRRDRPGGGGPSGVSAPSAGGTRKSATRPPRGASRPSPGRDQGEREAPTVPRARRLNPGTTHRRAVMSSLPPEEQAVADQVLRGGIPAVRTAIRLEKEKATAEGRPSPNADSLLTLAEQLLPRLKAAEWRDRAEAAAKVVDDITLRDLRSVVTGADVARDDETRLLATNLREALERRISSQQQEWLHEITAYLDEGRVVRALRVATRPPDVSTRLEPEVAERLSAAASEAMSPETAPERWLTLVEAVAASPVRRTVKPVGLPAEPGPALVRAAHQQAGRVPALATMLGVTMPPPPGPIRRTTPGRPVGSGSGPRRGGPRPAAPDSANAATDAGSPAPPPSPPLTARGDSGMGPPDGEAVLAAEAEPTSPS